MRKSILLSATLLIGLASCTKNDVTEVPQHEIAFSSPVVSAATKAVAGAVDKYSTEESFSVYALHTASNYTAWSTDAGTIYMNNVKCSYAGETANYWNPESAGNNSYYWPKQGYLSFVAYSPSDAASDCTISYNNDKFTFTDFTVKSTVSEQYDLMYSEVSKDRTTNTNQVTNPDYSASAVDINFKHALSQVKFTAKTEKEYTGTTIKVAKVSITNIGNKGTLTGDMSKTPIEASWSANAKDSTHYDIYNNELTLTTEAQGLADEAILLPQSLTNADMKVVIEYSITSPSGGEVAQKFSVPLKDLTVTAWEMGYKYTYNIIIGLEAIRFSPEVDPWVDASTQPEGPTIK